MKKSIFKIMALLFVALFSSAVLSSCSDDDEPSGDALKERLQGTWNFSKMKIKVADQTFVVGIDELKQASDADYIVDEVLSFNGDKVNGQYYEIKGNKILLPYYDGQDWWGEVSFSGSQLVLYYDITAEGMRVQEWAYYEPATRSASFILAQGNAALIPNSFSFVLK
ncbi:MAG: hypothetical protein PUC77_03675 [Bacteroidales bacterium]|nr:hypothetical protein [Bacteroidales bacterium]MDD6623155.1 hypothetical protein [Bacteroidales bacterium]